MFLNVLFKSLKSDPSMNRVKVSCIIKIILHWHLMIMCVIVVYCGMNVVPIFEYGVLLLQAFVKRMLYVCTCHSPSFVCGSLVLLSEVCPNTRCDVN